MAQFPYAIKRTFVDLGPPAIDEATLMAIQQVIITLYGGLGFWGTGADGDVTISGTTTLTGEKNYENLVVNTGGGILKPKQFPIWATELIDVAGTIDNTAANGSGINGGQSAGPHGHQGASNNITADGVNAYPSPYGFGGNGGNGGAGAVGGAGAGAQVQSPGTAYKRYPFRHVEIPGGLITGNTGYNRASSLDLIRGGGGGGAGGGDGSFLGGGGGEGCGPIILIAPIIHLRSTAQLLANGGNGASATSGNCGGGGGGGGGWFLFVCREFIDDGATYQAFGGANGIRTGTGSNGVVGSDGDITPKVVLLP